MKKKTIQSNQALRSFIILGIIVNVCFISVLLLHKLGIYPYREYRAYLDLQKYYQQWQLHQEEDISFKYPPDWILEEPREVANASGYYLNEYSELNEKEWVFSKDGIGGYTTMHLEIVRDYLPAGSSAPLLDSYIINETSIPLSSFKTVTYGSLTTKQYQEAAFTTIIAELPNHSGILEIYLSPEEYLELSMNDIIKRYLTPFMASLKVAEPQWGQLPPTISASTDIDTSNWKTFETTEYSIKYPPTWQFKRATSTDMEHANDIIFYRAPVRTHSYYQAPQFIIGSGQIFSTSGAICANGTCVGTIGIARVTMAQEQHFTRIIHKHQDLQAVYPNLYVFRINPGPVSSNLYITTFSEDLSQGQEIANILATFEWKTPHK